MRTRIRTLLLAAMLAVAPLRGDAEAPDSLVRLSFGSGWDALPAVVGIERGFFSQEGLVVSGLTVTSGEAVMQSLAAGSTDFALVPQRAFLVMVAAKLPVQAVALSGWGTRTELVVSPDLASARSIADLKGRKIAVITGSDALPALFRLAKHAKLKPSDLTVQQLSAESLVKAFAERKADAVFATAHFTEPLVSHGGARRLLSNQEIAQATGYVGAQPLVVSRKTVERDAALVQKFVNGWVKAMAYVEQDPEDAARLLLIFFHRQGVAATPEQTASWVGMTRHDRAVWTQNDTADAETNGSRLAEGGVFKARPGKLDGYVDSRYARKAAEKLASATAR